MFSSISIMLPLCLLSSVFAANHFYGVAVNNAKGNDNTYECRNQDDWNAVASEAASNGFKVLRIYATDCDAYNLASTAAKANGLKVLAGIYQSQPTVAASMDGIDADAKAFLSAVSKFGADLYVGLTVTNEIEDTGDNIMGAVKAVKSTVGSAFSGPVSAVAISNKYTTDPALCSADEVSANAQGFYGNVPSSGMSKYISDQINSLKSACPGKKIAITESGWPTRGGANGASNPTIKDAVAANQQLNCAAADTHIYLFEAQDSLWKDNDWERSYGVFNKDGLKVSDLFSTC